MMNKKNYLLGALILGASSVCYAQLPLHGSSYSQTFDSLAKGLPDGWYADTNASPRYRGASGPAIWAPGTTTRWSSAGGAFKNVASANSFKYWADATNALQLTATDRALAIRQTASLGDPGASFAFRLDHTYKLTDFEMSFRLQSLDSANGTKVSSWVLQYGLGYDPDTFFTLPGSIMYTGGSKYANDRYSFSFGKLLNDRRQPVWVRIVSLSAATGSGSRTVTALDDVSLTWKGTATEGVHPFVCATFPAADASDVEPGTVLYAVFSRNIHRGSGNIYVTNETSRDTQVVSMTSSDVSVSGKELTIAGVRLIPYSDYHITFDSTIVDTAGQLCFPVTDTTEWRFTTIPARGGTLPEFFETLCPSFAQPLGWQQYNKAGIQQWNCHEVSPGNSCMYMYGSDGAAPSVNEDWLISPLYDMSTMPIVMGGIRVSYQKSGPGNTLALLISKDYAGSGDPDSAVWSPVAWVGSSVSSGGWYTDKYPLPAGFETERCYLAFRYTSDAGEAHEVLLDSISVYNETSAVPELKANSATGLLVESPRQDNGIIRFFLNPGETNDYCISIYNVTGARVYCGKHRLSVGAWQQTISDVFLSPGLYIMEVNGGGQIMHARFITEK